MEGWDAAGWRNGHCTQELVLAAANQCAGVEATYNQKSMFSAFLLHWQYLWLVTASFLAGAINGMAGGGSFISFPAMLSMGVPPVEANATNTVALWPGQLTSIIALRKDVRRDLLPVVLITSLMGGLAGAELLLHTSQLTFTRLIPWLLLTGALLFWASAPVSRWLRNRSDHVASEQHQERPIAMLPLALALLPVTFYIGYFGAGSGFSHPHCACPVWHGADAGVERAESGCGGRFKLLCHDRLYRQRTYPLALLPHLHGVCRVGRVCGCPLRAQHESGYPASSGDRHRRYHRRIFFLEAALISNLSKETAP